MWYVGGDLTSWNPLFLARLQRGVGSKQKAVGVASSKKAIHYSPFIIYNSFIFNNISASNG